MKKKIIITGANGYIGARLVQSLSTEFEIIAHCFPSAPKDKLWLNKITHIIVGDLREDSVIEKISDLKVYALIHLVSLNHHQSAGKPTEVMSVNVNPTWMLLNAFSLKKNLKKFINFSTVHIYGKLPFELITENFKPNPSNQYALTHLLSEHIVNYYNDNFDITAYNLRVSNSYGSPVFEENNCWWLVINDLCKTAFEKKKITLKSDGSSLRDFINSSDLVYAISIILNIDHDIEHNTFNISSEESLPILEIAIIVKKVYFKKFGEDISIYINENQKIESPNLNANKQKFTISNERLRKKGFAIKTGIEEGVTELFDYLIKTNAK
jgi:nucleoside-diphosphate-sugar epimerase